MRYRVAVPMPSFAAACARFPPTARTEEYVRQVGGMVQPGQSAVFALLQVTDPEVVVGKFRGYGGKVLRSTLSARRTEDLKNTLAAN